MVHEREPHRFYEALREAAAHIPARTLHVFVSAGDVDSLCALKIALDLLKSDSVRFSAYPVLGYDTILGHAEKGMRDATEVPASASCPTPGRLRFTRLRQGRHPDAAEQTVRPVLAQPYAALFINCGATEDLARFLDLGGCASLFVADSHRPIHHRNLARDNWQVTVLCTDEDVGDAAVLEEASALGAESEDGAGSSSSGSEGEDDGRRWYGDGDAAEGEGGGHLGKRRGRPGGTGAAAAQEGRAAKRRRRQARAEYYGRGSYHGRSTGALLFEAAHRFRKDTSELLWLACVAVTDQYVHERIPNEQYALAAAEYKLQLLSHAEQPQTAALEDGLSTRIPDAYRIELCEEPRLMCLPFWTLLEALQYSTYTATKLRAWSEPGMRALRLLLARMGVPRREAEQRFEYMSSDVTRRLPQELQRAKDEYALADLFFEGFRRLHCYKMRISASDVVYGVTALLESRRPIAATAAGGEGPLASTDWAANFWTACAALSPKGWHQLQRGIDRSIQLQRAVVTQGSLALAKQRARAPGGGLGGGGGRRSRKFMWLALEDNQDTDLLAHPLALLKLLHFLMAAQREMGLPPRPLVVAATPPGARMTLVAGLSHKPAVGEVHGNRFGMSFRKAAEKLGLMYKHDGFESTWIEVDKAQTTRFLQELAIMELGR
eukprot:SM000043S15816  [mRNA]  locus=s43:383222:387211:+ [translate_table: standard]